MKKHIIILLAVVLGTLACNKQEEVINPLPESNYRPDMVAFSQHSRLLTDQLIDSIASLHNLYLSQGISDFNFNSTDYNEELYSQFETIGVNSFGLSLSDIEEVLDSADNDNYAFISVHSGDSDVIAIMDNVSNFIAAYPNCNFSDVQNEVQTQITYAINHLVGSDLDIALTFLRTFEKSSYFWLPLDKGGSGVGDDFIGDIEDHNPGVAINWGAIAYSDGAGAAGVLLRTWYMAGFVPLSWGAIVGAIGWGAAWASGTAILYQLM